jgi:uncharacterized protein (TIGR02118 family)
MHKLVIWIEPLPDWERFEADWPGFLRLVEALPGLRREATSRVDAVLYGQIPVAFMHELFFDSQADAQTAMTSLQWRQAGQVLQQITQGKMTLFFADHKEDELANIQRYQKPEEEVKAVADSG